MKPDIVPHQFDDADEGSAENHFLERAARFREIITPGYDHDNQSIGTRKVTPIHDDRAQCRCTCGFHESENKDSASIISADSNQEDHFRTASHLQYNQIPERVENSFTRNDSPLRNKTISVKVGNLHETDDSSLESNNVVTSSSAGCDSSFSVSPGISQNDVLCGRGKGANNFIGNRRFRDLVMSYRDVYSKCTRRSEKREICHNIVQAVRFRGGKFLTKDGKHRDTKSSPMGGWITLNDEKVIVKVSQALREGVAKWNKATQRYQEAKAKKVTLQSSFPSQASQGGVARWNKAKVKFEEAKVKTVALQSNAPAIALLAEISALQT